jgi:hypothetical protein
MSKQTRSKQSVKQASKSAKKQKTKVKRGTYKVTNWAQYNSALKQRGSLDIWISGDMLDSWEQQLAKQNNGKNGAPYHYPNSFIELVLQLGAVFHQPLRQTQGLALSVLKLLQLPATVPDYTTLSRRQPKLDAPLRRLPKDVVAAIIDSTGLKFYGEGEWKVKKHGAGKHRMWRKLHLGLDADGEIRLEELTDNAKTDAEAAVKLLNNAGADVNDFYADGAYDQHKVYEALMALGVSGVHIPPQRNAKIWIHGNTKAPPHPRDENLRAIRKTSRSGWKQRSGYHGRSLSETAMFRYKRIIGERVHSRSIKSQQNEAKIGCNILNLMAQLGMPNSTWQGKLSLSSQARAKTGFGVMA